VKFAISTLRRAESDIVGIHAWIAERSASGASRWYEAAREAIHSLAHDAEQHGLAREHKRVGIELREKLFKTRHGRPYRLLYIIDGEQVRVLRVRGPGQAPVTSDELSD
jgi:plasmid stabilization system protein ParE